MILDCQHDIFELKKRVTYVSGALNGISIWTRRLKREARILIIQKCKIVSLEKSGRREGEGGLSFWSPDINASRSCCRPHSPTQHALNAINCNVANAMLMSLLTKTVPGRGKFLGMVLFMMERRALGRYVTRVTVQATSGFSALRRIALCRPASFQVARIRC